MKRFAALDAVALPLVCFSVLYIASWLFLSTFLALSVEWVSLIAVVIATALSVAFLERGRRALGFGGGLRRAIAESAGGLLFAAMLIAAAAGMVVLTGGIRHAPGLGISWSEVALIYLPAAVHEELLFRGYGFQKLLRWSRPVALLGVAGLFALLHAWNPGLTWLAIANLFLGGVLLGLAYELYGRLWFPIALHLGWNVAMGPLFGHEVSGYVSASTLLTESGGGVIWLTGADFGLEGSVWMTVVEMAGIAILLRRRRANANSVTLGRSAGAAVGHRGDGSNPTETMIAQHEGVNGERDRNR